MLSTRSNASPCLSASTSRARSTKRLNSSGLSGFAAGLRGMRSSYTKLLKVGALLLVLALIGCQAAPSVSQLETRRQAIRQQCEQPQGTAQPFTKAAGCVNDGYRRWLAESRFPYTDLSEDWFSRRLTLAQELDAHGSPGATEAHSQFQALDRSFIAAVTARTISDHRADSPTTCQTDKLAVVVVSGGAAPGECH